jgi:hypothetical protein
MTSGVFAPQWLRLSEAVEHLSTITGFDKINAQGWLLRAIQDRLRGDKARYGKQEMFRIPGYPMRATTAVKLYEASRDFGRRY